MGTRPNLSRRAFLKYAGLTAAGATLAACAPPPTAVPPTAAPAATQAPAQTGAKQFKGVTLTLVGASGQPEYIAKDLFPKWAELTGASLQVASFPMADLPDKVSTSFATGTYLADVIMGSANMVGGFAESGILAEVPEWAKQEMDWNDIVPGYQNLLSWGGKIYGYPFDCDLHSLHYRKDVFGDAQMQKDFKAQYGYDLAAPEDWTQYLDQAKFFTGKDYNKNGDKQTYGAVEIVQRKATGFQGFQSRAASYAQHPDLGKAWHFDPDTMEPQINNPGFVQALQDWIDLMPYAPPGFDQTEYWGNVNAFFGGKAVLDVTWGLGVFSNDPKNTNIRGKLGYAITPGTKRVWNRKTKKWDDMPKVSHAPFLAFGGWVLLVPTTAKNLEAAQHFCAWLGNKENAVTLSTVGMLQGGSGVNPGRFSVLNDPETFAKMAQFPTVEDAKSHLDAIKETLNHPNVALDLRIPGYLEYTDAAELAYSKALAKQATPQAALDEAAAEWNRITDQLGRDKQKAAYRASMGVA